MRAAAAAVTTRPISEARSAAGPILSASNFGTSRAISASATASVTGTATEMAMQRSPAGELLKHWRSDIEVSTATGQLEVIRSRGGIGIVHDFMAADDGNLVRVLPQLAAHRTYWTVWHENMRATRRLDSTVRQSRGLFAPER